MTYRKLQKTKTALACPLKVCCGIWHQAFIIHSVVVAENITCDGENEELYIIQEGLESSGCTIVFLILYYFSMASSIWWVILTLTWFLAAGNKWGNETVESHSSYFHMVAWGLLALKTIVILTMRKVAGDELTWLCYVGSMDVGVLSCYLVIGTSFILTSFVALFHIWKVMKTEGSNMEKLEKLMVTVPSSTPTVSPALRINLLSLLASIDFSLLSQHTGELWLPQTHKASSA
ncbi:frizzled-9-like [Neoarius graeffei]|uniref:frizzled-9-like n=1 Tax=Neoarius graeffei TaxID=443677 RepID=UPI00298C56FE|nr:frizzled-9-like [Neoarius graeffei]